MGPMGLSGAPRASWWSRLWHRDLSGLMDVRERRLALRVDFPWATWAERNELAKVERAAADASNFASALDDELAARLRGSLKARTPWEALLSRLAAQQPEERGAIERLRPLLVPGKEYEAEDIQEAIRPASRRGFNMLLFALSCVEPVLSSHLVIVGPGGEALGRYETLDELPDSVTTPSGDVVRAGFGTVRVKYVVRGGAA